MIWKQIDYLNWMKTISPPTNSLPVTDSDNHLDQKSHLSSLGAGFD